MTVERFDGWIAGLGTATGLRAVVGHWADTPLGAFTDVMVERADGHRVLLAPDDRVADLVATTYVFDEVRVGPVEHAVHGDRREVVTADLRASYRVGRRPGLGYLLRAVPSRLATARPWLRLLDRVAPRIVPGVRTVGTAGGGRTEFYGARDLHRVEEATVTWEGADQGALAPVRPPVRFGFGSTPAAPSLVRVTTLIDAP